MLIYATSITGLQQPITQWTAEEGHRIRQVLDGAILYDARKGKGSLPCYFNTFTVLDHEKRSGPKAVEQLMRKVLQKGFNTSLLKRSRGSFRLVTSHENQLIAVDNRLRANIEKLIASRTGLVPDRRGGGREFWFLSRSEGLTLFMERHPAKHEHKLKKGELRPQLAYCLNRLADPTPNDVMIDPFCGYGAITKARAEYFPCKQIHGLDSDGQKIKALAAKAANMYKKADITQLSSLFPAQSVDVIVTDPPWGIFDTQDDIPTLYENLAKACRHILKPGGRMVILSAQKDLMQSWKPNARYDILVSGQKAAIFTFTNFT
ncbi:MAG: methyltransferase domain-containing protein [Defluviitaleaceae bacterium]|nr:methyltransferase domain-containing protein [Defluviitaleaceae bacterium]